MSGTHLVAAARRSSLIVSIVIMAATALAMAACPSGMTPDDRDEDAGAGFADMVVAPDAAAPTPSADDAQVDAGAVDAQRDAGDAAPSTTPLPAPKGFSDPGAYAAKSEANVGPSGGFSVYYPAPLGQNGVRHAIVTWGNGTSSPTFLYAPLLSHLASHGFVVIASNSTATGSGKEMLEGVTWLIDQSKRSSSKYYGKLDASAVCAVGHSQGGGGAVNAGNDSRVGCTAPIQPSPGNAAGLRGPMFVISGGKDSIVAPQLVEALTYGPATVPAIYGSLLEANHFTPMGTADGIRGYVTAWLRAQLYADAAAKALFYGNSCGICGDAKWSVKRKNL